MDAGEPSSTTGDTHRHRSVAFDVGLSFAVFFLVIVSFYSFYFCKRSRSPPSPTTDTDSDADNSIKLCRRISDDDVVPVTFPTFLYSEAVNDGGCSGCSICLGDYKTGEELRLLPECGHFFHVRCIDRWLRDHLICPVCRKELTPTTFP